MGSPISRRALLRRGAGGVLAVGVVAAGAGPLRHRLFAGDGEMPGPVPNAPVGDERVERRRSAARRRAIDFYTAVPADRVFAATDALRGTRIGLWCGRQDPLYDNVVRLSEALPEPPQAGGYADGRHTRRYWNRVTPAAFDFLAAALVG